MSNLVDHARRELDILASKGGHDEELSRIIVECIEKFAEYGHSGGSASWAIPVLTDLLQFKNLAPLTNKREDWIEVSDGCWQSRRNPEAFSHDFGHTYYLLSEGGSDNYPWPKHKSEMYYKKKAGSND